MTNPLTLPVIAVKQRWHLAAAHYELFSPDGTAVGKVDQTNANVLFHLSALFGDMDRMLPYELTVTDAHGQPHLVLSKSWFGWSKISVTRADGTELGAVVKKTVIGKATFELVADGQSVGRVKAQNWRAKDFQITTTGGDVVGRVSKQWRGMLWEGFTTTDSYVVDLQPLADLSAGGGDLHQLAAAAVFAIDVLMKQKR